MGFLVDERKDDRKIPYNLNFMMMLRSKSKRNNNDDDFNTESIHRINCSKSARDTLTHTFTPAIETKKGQQKSGYIIGSNPPLYVQIKEYKLTPHRIKDTHTYVFYPPFQAKLS